MRGTLEILIEAELYQLENWREAQETAALTHGEVYSWKTCGHENWLERGCSVVDVVALVVLPRGLPDFMDMPDDHPDEER